MRRENYTFGRYISHDNDSRWADADDIKCAPTVTQIDIEADDIPAGGIPIVSDGRTAYVDHSDTHTLILGSTGSKKTRLLGMPLINILAMAGESFIAMDPKNELYNKTSGLVAAKGYNTMVLNFRDLKQSDFWNPLTLPYELHHSGKTEEAVSLINDIIAALAEPQRRKSNDPYFIELGCAQALANMLFFIDTAAPEEANIYNFANFFATTCSPVDTERLAQLVANGSIASVNYKNVLTNKMAEKTFGNVSSCVSNMLNPFLLQKTLCQVLSRSSFDIRKLGESKNAIYIVVPDEKTTLHFLVTMFVKQTYEALINEAHRREDGKLPIRLNFVLDEFCNIPRIPDMPAMISAARSRNMRFFLMAQGMWQMKQKYGDDAETIKGNCDNWAFLTSREYALLQEISNLCGSASCKDPSGNVISQPLISVSELQRLKKETGETLILHGRNYPFVTKLPDIDDYKFKFLPPMPTKERQLPQIVQYDVEKVINEIKDQKRPLPFSVETSGKEEFFDNTITLGKPSELFDW